MLSTEESARIAATEEALKRPQTARPTRGSKNQLSEAKAASSSGGDQSSEDDQWFAQQRRTARGGAGARP